MDELQRYITAFTEIVPDAPAANFADLCFFKVALRSFPSATALERLIRARGPGEHAANIFDHLEHGYVELGAWLGSQELALRLMGMGTLLGLWQLLTPKTVLGDNATPELVTQLVGSGMVTIIVPRGPAGSSPKASSHDGGLM